MFAAVRGGSSNDPREDDAPAPQGLAEQVTRMGSGAAPAPASGGFDTNRMLLMIDAGKEPLRTFLIQHSSDSERAFFLRSVQRMLPPERRGGMTPDDFIVIVPAFTVSELTAAFQIGFLIFLPFLIIDLVVANILLALGMMMLSPTTVSLPFKLLLFVLIDGWAKLVHGLVLTYGVTG
ncbi:EscR/YscR/HrcR family type III secretion system export apparatus protein [Luteimonas terrae]|uniref:EscR/YscR/HrcR family type III secretion system export apparatus protein n=2 Tax=Luteimonas terrae TaxID=1530191 RepID=A0A4R5U5R9_9GAMM|nr:EscR/YscR/HrcR family type III secretion system export apparatus protein [Luteimonas terrae]